MQNPSLIDVQEHTVQDTIAIVANLVRSGQGDAWALGVLENLEIPVPKDLQSRILAGTSTDHDAESLELLADRLLPN
jgi:hypothetical protein